MDEKKVLSRRKNWFYKMLYRRPGSERFTVPELLLMQIGNLTIALLILILMFLCVEYASRAILPHNGGFDLGFDAGLTRRPFPFIMFKGKPSSLVGADKTPLNELGYRGPAPTLNKKDGEFRIFFMGGSTVWNGEPPIPELVESLFHKNGHPEVRVFNFGVVASTSHMDLARILFDASDYHPDLVVFYNGANDISHPYYADPRPGYPTNFFIYENNPFFLKARDYPGPALLAYNSNVLRLFLGHFFSNKFSSFDQLRDNAHYNSDAWRDEIAHKYLLSLQKAQAVSNAFGAEFITFFQPMLFFKDKLSEAEIEDPNLGDKSHHVYVRDKIISESKASAGELNNFVDLSGFFNNHEEQIFTDFVHTTQEAKELMAAELVLRLEGFLPPQQ